MQLLGRDVRKYPRFVSDAFRLSSSRRALLSRRANSELFDAPSSAAMISVGVTFYQTRVCSTRSARVTSCDREIATFVIHDFCGVDDRLSRIDKFKSSISLFSFFFSLFSFLFSLSLSLFFFSFLFLLRPISLDRSIGGPCTRSISRLGVFLRWHAWATLVVLDKHRPRL